jgi:hypothetical protein
MPKTFSVHKYFGLLLCQKYYFFLQIITNKINIHLLCNMFVLINFEDEE